MRFLGRALKILVVTAALLVAMVYLVSEYQLRRKYSVSAAPIPGRSDPAGLSRGEHLFRTINCALCHGTDGGGKLYIDAGPIGIAVGSNLTRGQGGIGSRRSDLDLVRAIRHGVRPDSTSLLLMPSEVFVHLSDEDLGAIIGYVRSLPPVDRDLPPSRLRWLGRALHVAGKMNLLVASKTPGFIPRAALAPGPTPEYGRYLASISSCHGCHGSQLSGGRLDAPGVPPASNLTPAGLSQWTETDFFTAMRQGRRPDGSVLHEIMPWRQYRQLTDAELTGLWLYLRSVPPRPSGGK